MTEPIEPGDWLRLWVPPDSDEPERIFRRLVLAAVQSAQRGQRSGELRNGERLVGRWVFEKAPVVPTAPAVKRTTE